MKWSQSIVDIKVAEAKKVAADLSTVKSKDPNKKVKASNIIKNKDEHKEIKSLYEKSKQKSLIKDWWTPPEELKELSDEEKDKIVQKFFSKTAALMYNKDTTFL